MNPKGSKYQTSPSKTTFTRKKINRIEIKNNYKKTNKKQQKSKKEKNNCEQYKRSYLKTK